MTFPKERKGGENVSNGLLFDPPKNCETLEEYIETLNQMMDDILKKEEQDEDADRH